MKILLFCAILIALEASPQVIALTANRTSKLEPVRYKLFNNQEQLTNKYNALLLGFVMIHLEEYRNNVVFSSKSCSICDGVLGVLMNASVQSFLSADDIAITNSSVVQNVTSIVPNAGYYGFVIFLVENTNEISEHLVKLQSMHAWNPRARHLIFTAEKPDDDELEMIFKQCWSHRILNVAVIIQNQEEAYTYNPYLNDHSEMREKVQNWSILYYDKLRNMNGYAIRTRYVPFSGSYVAKWIEEEKRYKFFGSDFGYAEAFFQSVNATPAFIDLAVETVHCYENFTYRYKIWKELRFNDAELWMNFMTIQSKFRDRVEKTYPLRRDNIRILAPKSGLRTPSILDPYNITTWICVVFSIIIFALYSCLFNKTRGIEDNAFLRTFGIFLGKSLAKGRHDFLDKFTFSVFTMTSLLILSAYQGALYGALATVSHYPEINTINQLRERIKTIHTLRIIADFFQGYMETGINLVAFDTEVYVEYMETHRDEAYAFVNTNAEHIVNLKVLSRNGIPFYHMMSDYSFPAFVSHTLPYGSPYLKKLEYVFLACKEAGLDQYWDAEASLNAVLSATTIPNVVGEKPLKKLSLGTQLIGFYIWGIGLLLSSICFIAEHYSYKYGVKMLSCFQGRNY